MIISAIVIKLICIFIKLYNMAFLKRIYQDVQGVSCPLCGASVLKDARNAKKITYFCSGKTTHDLTNNKTIKAFLIGEALTRHHTRAQI
jgi:hypothetical protein